MVQQPLLAALSASAVLSARSELVFLEFTDFFCHGKNLYSLLKVLEYIIGTSFIIKSNIEVDYENIIFLYLIYFQNAIKQIF